MGNLPPDVTESELTELFDKHGLLDGITCYATRSYAFVYYKRAEDAASAKEALQGFLINGNSIKIEFAKPVCSFLRILVIMLICNRITSTVFGMLIRLVIVVTGFCFREIRFEFRQCVWL